MIPIRTTAPRFGRPVLVYVLIAACAGVFLWQQLLPDDQSWYLVRRWALVPRGLTDAKWAALHGLSSTPFWSALTMAFLHGGWLHIISNMWTLWLLGRSVEARLGIARFAGLYVVSAVLASGAHVLADPASPVPTLGASGAVAGVIGAYAALYPRSRVVLLVPVWFFPLIFQLSALVFAAVWFGLQLLSGTGLLFGASASIAWWAHIGGLIAGSAFVLVWPPRPLPPSAAASPAIPATAEPAAVPLAGHAEPPRRGSVPSVSRGRREEPFDRRPD